VNTNITQTVSTVSIMKYVKVHIQVAGIVTTNFVDTKQSMYDMIDFLEAHEHNYVLDIDNDKMDQFIPYVVGFEIEILSWEGKFKLSQDKKPQDMEQAKAELIRANQESIRAFLDKVF